MKVKSESEVAQSCLTLHNPMDWSLLGSSVHGIFQARVLEGVPLPSPNEPPGKPQMINIMVNVKRSFSSEHFT